MGKSFPSINCVMTLANRSKFYFPTKHRPVRIFGASVNSSDADGLHGEKGIYLVRLLLNDDQLSSCILLLLIVTFCMQICKSIHIPNIISMSNM